MQTLQINMNHDPSQLNFSSQAIANDLNVDRLLEIMQLATRTRNNTSN